MNDAAADLKVRGYRRNRKPRALRRQNKVELEAASPPSYIRVFSLFGKAADGDAEDFADLVYVHVKNFGRCCEYLLVRFLAEHDAARGSRFEGSGYKPRLEYHDKAAEILASATVAELVGKSWRVGLEPCSLTRRSIEWPPLGAPLVVTFVSESYTPLLELWLNHYSASASHELLVVALDDASYEYATRCLAGRHATAKRIQVDSEKRHSIWKARLALLDEMVSLTHSDRVIVHSDLDCFWLGDAVTVAVETVLSVDDECLGAFSIDQGTGNLNKSFALCPGWFALRPGPATAAFVEEWKARGETDDQIALNRIYDARLADRARGVATLPDLKILPYAQFQRCIGSRRPCEAGSPPPLVWHPWLDHNKHTIAQKLKVWRPVLEELARGSTASLDEFYELKASTLTPRVYQSILDSRARRLLLSSGER